MFSIQQLCPQSPYHHNARKVQQNGVINNVFPTWNRTAKETQLKQTPRVTGFVGLLREGPFLEIAIDATAGDYNTHSDNHVFVSSETRVATGNKLA